MITMAWSDFGKAEKKYVNAVLDSGWLSRKTYIPKFEQAIAKLHGQKFGMMCNSGTDALRIGLATLKEVDGWEDQSEVLVPAVTFVATVNAVLQVGLKPRFVDVDRCSYTIDLEQVEKSITPQTVAILPVHLFGLPVPTARLAAIGSKFKIRILEDSCEALGVHSVQGDMAAFSTYMAHMVQTGVGGILTTNDRKLDKIARSYMNHGRSDNPHRFEFERIGYSSRVTELEAALGCAQLERFAKILKRRQEIAWRLIQKLYPTDTVQLPHFGFVAPYTDLSSWMLFPLVLLKGNRDKFMAFMHKRGIETRQMMPLTDQPCYKHLVKEDDFPVAQWINKNGVCLPCHQLLTDKDVDTMAKCVQEFFWQ